MSALPTDVRFRRAPGPWTVASGPERVGSELRWQLQGPDGSRALLGRLVGELAEDASLRRRYQRDVEAWSRAPRAALAELLDWSEPGADGAPWRLRARPTGERMDRWMQRRGPLPVDEAVGLLAKLAEDLGSLHRAGLVLRELSPGRIIISPEGPVLFDVGLARVDILSTRSAASLVLEGSAYAAPELLLSTRVDGRADLYALGVIAFEMLTGELPHGDRHLLMRGDAPAPAPSSLRAGLPAELDRLTSSLLAADVDARPASAFGVAEFLRGEGSLEDFGLEGIECQHCSALLPVGQRLCLSCGRVGVRFVAAGSEVPPRERFKLVLTKAQEDAAWTTAFHEILENVSAGGEDPLEFLVGDPRMYSREEQKRRVRVPATLFTDLDRATADALAERFKGNAISVKVKHLDAFDRGDGGLRRGQRIGVGVLTGATLFAATIGGLAGGAFAAVMVGALGGICTVAAGLGMRKSNQTQRLRWGRSLRELRAAPAALPASDPLVASIAETLSRTSSEDVSELVGKAALWVQRLVDHRAGNLGAAAEIELAVAPVAGVVEAIDAQVRHLALLDAELSELDEGVLVRQLAVARARGAAEAEVERMLRKLDRLRELEEARAQAMGALLEAHDLMRRAAEIGLSVHDEAEVQERRIRAAMQQLALPAGELEAEA